MLEAIQNKFLGIRQDDLQWPLISPTGSVLPIPTPAPAAKVVRFNSMSPLGSNPDLTIEDQSPAAENSDQQYWDFIAQKYHNSLPSLATLSTPLTQSLPSHWTIISITLTEDKNTLFVTRQAASREPLIFCVPLKGRRDNVAIEDQGEDGEDEEGGLTFDAAVAELQEIIRLSDQGTRNAADVKKNDKEARIKWWGERTQLDRRMKDLLVNIEFCWLGAFKVR